LSVKEASVGIRYSMRGPICDVINYRTSSFVSGKIPRSLYDKIVKTFKVE